MRVQQLVRGASCLLLRSAAASPRILLAALAFSLTLTMLPPAALAASPTIVISQVYGGGGNSGATYTNDFIELHNRSDVAVSVAGWTVQYASASGTTWSSTALSGSIAAGGYYLIQQAAGTGGSTALPTPDVIGTIAMSASSAKVALVSSTTLLSGSCPTGGSIVDVVGYGSATCSETAPTATLANTVAAIRKRDGCADTDHNSADFSLSSPLPRNSATAARPCNYTLDAVVSPLASGSVTRSPDQASYLDGAGVQLTAAAITGWHFVGWSGDASGSTNPLDVTMDADKSITATFAIDQHTLAVATVGSGSVAKAPDQATYDYGSTVQLTATPAVGWHFVDWSGDASGSTNPLDVTMDSDKSITATFAENQVVVSQVYGGGGNTGATYTHDFIELFNRGSTPVDLTGWTVQYGSSGGSTWQTTALSGTILPGRYYLVQQAQGAGGSTSLPTPDATGAIAMSATAGKVALVNDGTALAGACPIGPSIEDLIGYGAANCSETTPVGSLSNLNAAHRKGNGCVDTDHNSADLLIGPPTPRNSASPFNNCEFTLAVTVSPSATGSVTVSPLQASYANGSQVQLTATPVFGHHFVKWTGHASGNTNPLTITMDSDKSIVAHFASNSLIDGIVISQIYGGGGNSGATYKQDFVELYNRGNFAVDITGWSLQYASDNGTVWFSTNLIGTIQPGQNYLIRQAQGAGGTLDTPTPDAIGTVAMSASGGKVALCTDGVVLTGSCPTSASIRDYVGYGSADCFEIVAAASLDNVTAAHRNSDGCDDIDHNLGDFHTGAPNPRNTAMPVHFCPEWVDVGPVAVTEFALSPVAPNPSRGVSRVSFALPVESRVRLQVMDLQGRVVTSLADGTWPAGRHSIQWDGSSPGGPARSGMYFVRLEANDRRFVRSMMLTR